MPLAGGALAVAGPLAWAFHVMQPESGFGAWRAAFQESRQQSTDREPSLILRASRTGLLRIAAGHSDAAKRAAECRNTAFDPANRCAPMGLQYIDVVLSHRQGPD
eukprot:scaffold3986_cov221-Prasinococcus_capsulatus_cf.AAC.1